MTASRPAAELVVDVLDLAGAVAVAGLAWPDPELPAELRELAARARALRLGEGVERLDRLAQALDVAVAADPEARREAVRVAIDAFQRLVAWARLMRVELELLGAEERSRSGPAEA